MNLSDIPDWIKGGWPNSRNMAQLADQLAGAIGGIAPYVEASFCSNHIKAEECRHPEVHAKSLWEGLWHLHVLWCMHAHGLRLVNPDSVGSADDGIVIYNDENIGIEATFTSWGNPNGPLATTYSEMANGGASLNHLDVDISDQIVTALIGKERKLAARQPTLTRLVALNEVYATAGFVGSVSEAEGRRSRVASSFQSRSQTAITCITYDYVGYRSFFSEPRLTLIAVGPDQNKYLGLASLLAS